MSDMLEVTPSGAGIEVHGPFLPEYRVTLGGYHVPYITAQPTEDGKFFVTVDHRMGMHLPVTKDELDNWMPILANAMAVAAGYPCHGRDLPKMNPFNLRMSSLGSIESKPDLSIIDGGKTE